MTNLEKVILEEISHGSIRWNVPPSIQVEVQTGQIGHQDQRSQLGLVSDTYDRG